jgi:hypothetical protein
MYLERGLAVDADPWVSTCGEGEEREKRDIEFPFSSPFLFTHTFSYFLPHHQSVSLFTPAL